MTYKKALDSLRYEVDEEGHCSYIEDEIHVAMEALEKQIPMKPIEDQYPWAICPACGGSVYLENVREHIESQETTYCEHCGQALDWGDTE